MRIQAQFQCVSERRARQRQQTAERTIKRKSISIPEELMEAAMANAARRGFKQSFSAYISWLIERDAAGAVVREHIAPEIVALRAAEEPEANNGRLN
jgi:hypothetical protein